MAVKLKNLKTGQVIPRTFQGAEKIQPADISMKKAQFLYSDDDGFHFMDAESFEQFSLSKEVVGSQGAFLTDGDEYDLQYFGDAPIAVQLPTKMVFEVTETPPGVKGDTATGGTKQAALSCGVTVQVPLFIATGERIRIHTETLEYVERA